MIEQRFFLPNQNEKRLLSQLKPGTYFLWHKRLYQKRRKSRNGVFAQDVANNRKIWIGGNAVVTV